MSLQEQARAELARRESLREAARAELARREQTTDRTALQEETTPERGLGQAALRQVGRVGRSAATGLAGLADVPNLISLGAHAAGLKKDPLFWESQAQKTKDYIDDLTKGTLKPEGKGEEYADEIMESLAPMAFAPLTGGASLTGAVARQGLKRAGTRASRVAEKIPKSYELTKGNIAGTAGAASAMKHYREEMSEDPGFVEQMIVGGLGGAAARGAAKGLTPRDSFASGVGRATGFNPKKYAEQAELDIPSSLGTSSDRGLTKTLDQYLKHHPISSKGLKDFKIDQEKAIARNLGISGDDIHASVRGIPKHLAKEGAKGYKEKIQKEFGELEKIFGPRLKQAIDAGELVDVGDIHDRLKETKRGLRSEGALKDFDASPEGKNLNMLDSYLQNPYTRQEVKKTPYLARLQGDDKKIAYGDFEQGRRKAGLEADRLKASQPGSKESRDASRFSHELAERRNDWTQAHGSPREAHAARTARKKYHAYANKETGVKDYVEDLLGTQDDAEAFRKLTQTERYTKAAMEGLPKNKRKDLTESILANLGKQEDYFSANKAFSGFHKLSDPVKEEVMKGFSPEDRKSFHRVMDFISKHKKEVGEIENTSRTAYTQEGFEFLKKGIHAVTALTPLTGIFAPKTTALYLGHLAGTYGLAKVWTNPVFLRRVDKVITAQNARKQAGALKMLMHTPVLREEAKRLQAQEQREED